MILIAMVLGAEIEKGILTTMWPQLHQNLQGSRKPPQWNIRRRSRDNLQDTQNRQQNCLFFCRKVDELNKKMFIMSHWAVIRSKLS